MEVNEELRDQIFGIVETQLKENNPPETKITYDRLRKEGFTDHDTRRMIGQCVAMQLFNVLKLGKSFDEERYLKDLEALPEEPFD